MFLIKIPLKLKAPQGVIEKWLVHGGPVKKDDILFVLKTANEIVEVKCPQETALLKITKAEGSIVNPGQIVGVLGQIGQDLSSLKDLLKEPDLPSFEAEIDETAIPSEGFKPAVSKEVKMTPESKTPQTGGKVIPILMPQAGQTMEEGTLLSWKVKEGDQISVGQVICEIETDKASMEVEATDGGRLARIVVKEGQTVAVRVPVAYLAQSDADVDAYLASIAGDKPSEAASQPQTPKAEVPSDLSVAPAAAGISDTGRVMASPAARKIAAERGIDLASVSSGSGPGGRILSSDLEKVKIPTGGAIPRPLSKMRKAIAGNLLYSKQNIPHFYAKLTVDAQALYDTYKQTKEKYKCSVNDFVTLAVARAIREYPAFRSQFKDNQILEFPDVNIGIAVGTDQGLTVPVLVRADQMNLRDLADKTRQIAANAREGKLEGIGLGIFTITNLGMFGVEEFSAIINPPESAILAVGALREGIKVENGQILPTRLMTLVLSSDHRIIDGVLSARFLQTLKDLLEHPQQLGQE